MQLTSFLRPLLLVAAVAATQAAAAPAPAAAPKAGKTATATAAVKAAKPAVNKPAKTPPAKPAAAARARLPPASEEQRSAAALVFHGSHDCEFDRTVVIAPNALDEAYVDVQFGKQTWVMRPVLSSTGARRLEDVEGRMLLLQIAFKSMLMDVRAGTRVADECVHQNHRVAMREADALALASGLAGRGAAGSLLGGAALRVRILETTDLHMNLLGWDYYQDKPVEDYGLDRTATLIKAARAEVRNTLLIDNGDLLQGSPLGDWVAQIRPPPQPGESVPVHPAFKVMNALGYDAASIGNHEFNYGLPFLQQSLAGAAFPYVNANIVADNAEAKNVFAPYVILQRSFSDEAGTAHQIKIGVIGFVPPQVLVWDRQNLLGSVLARDIPQTARELVPRIKAEGADIVVAVAHSGFERGETLFLAENTVARLAEVPGVDAILFGHSHGEFPGRFFNSHPLVDLARGTINGIPATMPGFWGSHLGVIDLTLERSGTAGWRVVSGSAGLRPVYDRSARKALVEPDPTIAPLIAAEHEATQAWMRSPVATTAVAIHSYFAQVADDPSVQIVAQAQLAYARNALAGTAHAALPLLSAAAPFKTGGRGGINNYTDIAAGPLAVRNVADLYIYPNTVKVVKLSGAQVREWLEMAAGAFNRIDPQGAPEQNLVNASFPSFNFDTLDGVTYRIDVTQPARYDRGGKLVAADARRIVELRFGGQPVDDNAAFAVVTNNHRASGGGGFPGLDGSNIILDAPDQNRQVLLQYMRAAKQVDPAADNNWALLPVPGIKLRFDSGAGGIPHLARYPQITLVKDNGDGSALYELKP